MPDEPLIDPLLVSNFVHQIINPLNGVVGTLSNIIDGTTKRDRRDQRLKAAQAQLIHSIELVRNLAFLSQISLDHGTVMITEKAVNVTVPEVIIEAAQYFQEVASMRRIQIELTDPTTQYLVKGHPTLLRQVFMNIFDNAVKYSDEDTIVAVTPRGQRETGQLIIDVENTGTGFDFGEREKIFDRGYRTIEAREVKASGTGIGLYICRRILEDAHLATVEAEHSPKTRRTIIRIRFPAFSVGEEFKGRDRGR
jgi:signal transduction histidine kinase